MVNVEESLPALSDNVLKIVHELVSHHVQRVIGRISVQGGFPKWRLQNFTNAHLGFGNNLVDFLEALFLVCGNRLVTF